MFNEDASETPNRCYGATAPRRLIPGLLPQTYPIDLATSLQAHQSSSQQLHDACWNSWTQ